MLSVLEGREELVAFELFRRLDQERLDGVRWKEQDLALWPSGGEA